MAEESEDVPVMNPIHKSRTRSFLRFGKRSGGNSNSNENEDTMDLAKRRDNFLRFGKRMPFDQLDPENFCEEFENFLICKLLRPEPSKKASRDFLRFG